VTTDYSVSCDTGGYSDTIDICKFSGGNSLNRRGLNLIKEEWMKEEPKIEQYVLTILVTEKWTFNKNDYYNLEKVKRC